MAGKGQHEPSPENPQPGAGGSSPRSSTGSPAEGLIEDAGPAFDPEAASAEPPPEPPAPEEPLALEQWEEEVISGILGLKGRALHAAIGVAEEDWRYTESNLADIVPPLTRIFNRYPALRRYAPYADPITAAMGLGGYAVRSLEERRAELRALEEEAAPTEVPIEPLASPPPAQRPSAFPAGEAKPKPPAPQAAAPAKGRRRPGEADVDPGSVEWEVAE